MQSLCLTHITIIRHPQPIEDAAILIEDGKIGRLGLADDLGSLLASASKKPKIIDCHGLLLAPGFIDLQCNGGFGHDFTHDPSTIGTVAAQLPQFGVTGFLPTVITAPISVVEAVRKEVKSGKGKVGKGAAMLGVHVEGPMLNPAKKGAHNADYLRVLDSAEIAHWSPKNGIRLVTLAPELTGVTPLIKQLTANGVIVSAGHSMATFEQAIAGFAAGIRYGTHLFNAMPPLHHRQPALPAALLSDARVTIGLIPDGVHVHPALIKLVWQLAKGRVNVVTDAMAAMGYGEGSYQLGDQTVSVDATSARLADGRLAGSIVTLDLAVRNLRAWTGCSIAEAICTVTEIPADLLNLPHKGRITAGADADLVLLTDQLAVQMTIVGGKIVWRK
ncbi:MAG TPA: N-acetylglucosamine-6-phosphate deacetylase [Anaerolineae bacterium]|nr:N-acetylglucosamine-6-phosphate deacetylase [Anaerolineae bacterium]